MFNLMITERAIGLVIEPKYSLVQTFPKALHSD